MKLRYLLLLLLIFASFILVSCSNNGKGKNVLDENPLTLPASHEGTQGYADWGDFTIQLDIENRKAELIPNRDSDIHLDVNPYLAGGGLNVSFVSWDPVTYELKLDFELNNPTNLSVSDVRLIFTDFAQVSYPQYLIEPDSWTTAMTGNVRPFLAFKKDITNRVFSGLDSETLTARIYWPPGSPFMLNFKVTAWLWLNCQDVYEINNMGQSGRLFQNSGTSIISCYPKDWQNDVFQVRLWANALTGEIHEMTKEGLFWEYELTNILNKPPGLYQVWIEAISPNPQNYSTWNKMYIKVDDYGWQSSPNYYHGEISYGSYDIACYAYDGYDRVNILSGKGNATGWISHSPGINHSAQDLVNLKNLDPNYPAYQPWCPEKIDAAKDGAFAWTNLNHTIWYSFYKNYNTLSFMRNSLIFAYEPLYNDNRALWYQGGTENGLVPYDVCDTFAGRLGALMAYNGPNKTAVIAVYDGPATGNYNYFDRDLNGFNQFTSTMFGSDDGQIILQFTSGIDIMETDVPGEYLVFLSQYYVSKIEVFKMVVGSTNIEYVDTIHISYMGEPAPIDIELLPANPDYDPAPDTDILCVLVDRQEVNGQTGGIVLMYDANTRNYLGSIGDPSVPACPFPPRRMDTDDDSFSIVISQQSNASMILTQWTYYEVP